MLKGCKNYANFCGAIGLSVGSFVISVSFKSISCLIPLGSSSFSGILSGLTRADDVPIVWLIGYVFIKIFRPVSLLS